MNKFDYHAKASDFDLPVDFLLVMPVFERRGVTHCLHGLTNGIAGQLESLERFKNFSGKSGLVEDLSIESDSYQANAMLVGCGRMSRFSERRFLQILEKISARVVKSKSSAVICAFHHVSVRHRKNSWRYEQLIQYIERRAYRYNPNFSAASVRKKASKCQVLMTVDEPSMKQAHLAIAEGKASSRGVLLARNLGDLPPNICTPTYLATFALGLADAHKNVTARILNESDMSELGMGAFLAVTQGSAEPAKLIVLEYRGTKNSAQPYCLVGKGVTFDSGGLSLKPPAAMEKMKYDMCGAASVLGAFNAAMELELPINLVAVIAAAENLPGGSAVKPGDVVTSMSGLTVEILNTDAEGRLMLCDALSFAKSFKPRVVIDVATLTGSCVQALGKYLHGLFSNSDSLARSLEKAGRGASDPAWRLPVGEPYTASIKSKVADQSNIGGEGAGAVVAASFLLRHVSRYRWAHLDVAGTATKSGVGATGRPVALLVKYLSTRKAQ